MDPVCNSLVFNPQLPVLDIPGVEEAGASPAVETDGQAPAFEGGIVPVDPRSGIDNSPVATPSDAPTPTSTP